MIVLTIAKGAGMSHLPDRSSVIERMIGAARLNVATYEEVEHDANATAQAGLIVMAAALIAGLATYPVSGLDNVGGTFVQVFMSWLVTSALAYLVGTKLIPGTETQSSVEELLRTIGFAHTPYFLWVLAIVPILGSFAVLIGTIWALVAQVVAIRQALDISTGRAIAVILLSFVVLIVFAIVLVIVIGVGIATFG